MKKAVCGIYTGMNKMSEVVQKILEVMVVLLVISCAADLLLQVVYRFILVNFVSWSCSWTTEYATGCVEFGYIFDGRQCAIKKEVWLL